MARSHLLPRPRAHGLAPAVAVALMLFADSLAAEPPFGDAVFVVEGPALLSDRLGADAIRVGAGTVAIRSGCEAAPVEVHTTREGDTVLRGFFTHCAADAETVSVWLRIREDGSRLVGRIGLLPKRKVRLFEAVRVSEESAAWPEERSCSPLPEAAVCE